MQKDSFYITTTLPYVNADPHIGFALEVVHADIIARWHRLMGRDVFFNTGTDEHGIKILRKAQELGVDPQAYVDDYAARFKHLMAMEVLNIDFSNFIRTTDSKHKEAAQEFWRRCQKNGDIYKKNYKVKYCVGCELEKTDSELENGHCPLHPNLEIEIIEEENYFFKLSNYQKRLLSLYAERSDFVLPEPQFVEVKKFVERGLQDFSISRLKEKMPWGVFVPGDDAHVMYVWFDALVNYISAIGWPDDMGRFEKWWPVTQLAGKDQVRQQVVMWQAMLFSAGILPSRQVIIHGFITSGGQKMSKSLGNVVNPLEIVEKYGTDPLRYFLARHMHPFDDSDFSEGVFKEAYNANLANGLGNVTARIMRLAEDNLSTPIEHPAPKGFLGEYMKAIESFELNRAMDVVWSEIKKLDERITREEPFKLIKSNPEAGRVLIAELVMGLYQIGRMLNPFMPETSQKIKETILQNKKPETLFPRKD
ncbi:MAG TPA: methionine--tRNA ligase [Candidatus Paceibacterota bacterium]